MASASRLAFYPNWIVLDAYGRDRSYTVLSLELPILDLVELSGANVAEDASAVQAGQNKVWEVVDLNLRYDTSFIPLDVVPLLTNAQNPHYHSVQQNSQTYQVADNLYRFLVSLGVSLP